MFSLQHPHSMTSMLVPFIKQQKKKNNCFFFLGSDTRFLVNVIQKAEVRCDLDVTLNKRKTFEG